MEPETARYSFPTDLIKIRKRDTTKGATIDLPSRVNPKAPDTYLDEPWRDYKTIDRTYANAPGDYTYRPLTEPNTIRLLKLLPGDASEIIRIDLLTVDLDADPDYDALSYEWGIPARSSSQVKNSPLVVSVELEVMRHVLCQGQKMAIGENLHIVLLRLRDRFESRILWADAVCINQEDFVEKPTQLMLMGRIYRQAKTVLCWIGRERQSSRNAFRLISTVAEAFKVTIRGTREEHIKAGSPSPVITLDEEVVEEIHGDGWLGLLDVFTRPYFGRIWVVQEIVLSQRAMIVCGTNRIPWLDFLNVSKFIAATGTKIDQRVQDLTDTIEKSQDGVDYVKHMKVSRIVNQTDLEVSQFSKQWYRVIKLGDLQDAYASKRNSLTYCVEQLLGHEVTDPKDRVYGMLGMITAKSSYAKTHPLIPDYKKRTQQVYREAAEWAIKDLNSLKILDICETPAANVTPDLPTWVPDLSKGIAPCQGHESNAKAPPLFSILSWKFAVSFNANTLSVQAHIVDTVVVARPPFTYGLKPVLMMQHFKEFAYREINQREPIYPTGCTKLEAFWRTLIADTVLDITDGNSQAGSPRPGFDKHFMKYNALEFISNWGLSTQLTGKEPDLWDLRLNGAPFPLEDMFPEDVYNNISILALMAKQPFVRWMYKCAREGDEKMWKPQVIERHWLCDEDYGRQFFFTHQGWMGIGHPCKVLKVGSGNVSVAEGSGVKVGDVLAVLAGSDRVWILRRDGTGVYAIVGQAYVYGLSEGKGFDLKKLPELKTIRIK